MSTEFFAMLRSPNNGKPLRAVDVASRPIDPASPFVEGWLVSEDDTERFPVMGGIPRFVPARNYADSFGMQWNHFSRTQLDSYSGLPISAERFWAATGWNPEELAGRWVLDIGCGAGRFAEVALNAGAHVVALDYSSAVNACATNLQSHARLHVVQGDIYALPFAPASFDFVYSLGVLQHTPDVERAFLALPPMVRAGGRFCADFYCKSWKSALLPKYWLRPLTKRLPKMTLFAALQKLVPLMLPLSVMLGRIPLIGRFLKRIVPVANFDGQLALNSQQHREWSLLDTFDWLSPTYDNPQTPQTLGAWLERAGLVECQVLHAGHLVGRGRRP